MVALGRRAGAAWNAPRLARFRPAWAWPLGAVAVALVTALLRWPYLDVPISADEGGYATAAYWWARGDTLYQNITITRPQGIFVVFRAIDALGLGSVRGIHLFAAGCTALSALALLLVVARVWGRGVGLGAALLFGVLMATPYAEGYQANAELFMLLPLLLSLYLLLRADGLPLASAGCRWLLAGSGLLAAVALLVKPSGVAVLALAMLWLARRWRVERTPWRAWFGAELALGAGFVAGIVPALIHGLVTAPEIYLDAVLLYRLGSDSVLRDALGHQWEYFRTNSLFVIARLPILLLTPVGLMRASRLARTRGRDLLGLWMVTSLAGTALGGNWFLHYYQQLLPVLAVAVVLVLSTLWRRPRRAGEAVLQGLALAGIAALAMTVAPSLLRPVDPATLPEYEPSIADVALYLQTHTTSAEKIYVAYDHADIYYLSQRYPAARWLHFRELLWTPGAFDRQVARLADPTTAPRYIVGAQAFDRWGFDKQGTLRAVVARDYVLETTIDGIPLYRRR